MWFNVWVESFKIYKRDRYNHSSPNSAHPEAAVAGALGIRLGGINYFLGMIVALIIRCILEVIIWI